MNYIIITALNTKNKKHINMKPVKKANQTEKNEVALPSTNVASEKTSRPYNKRKRYEKKAVVKVENNIATVEVKQPYVAYVECTEEVATIDQSTLNQNQIVVLNEPITEDIKPLLEGPKPKKANWFVRVGRAISSLFKSKKK